MCHKYSSSLDCSLAEAMQPKAPSVQWHPQRCLCMINCGALSYQSNCWYGPKPAFLSLISVQSFEIPVVLLLKSNYLNFFTKWYKRAPAFHFFLDHTQEWSRRAPFAQDQSFTSGYLVELIKCLSSQTDILLSQPPPMERKPIYNFKSIYWGYMSYT